MKSMSFYLLDVMISLVYETVSKISAFMVLKHRVARPLKKSPLVRKVKSQTPNFRKGKTKSLLKSYSKRLS